MTPEDQSTTVTQSTAEAILELELVPFKNTRISSPRISSRLDMSSSDIEPNLVHFLSDTPSGQSVLGSQLYRPLALVISGPRTPPLARITGMSTFSKFRLDILAASVTVNYTPSTIFLGPRLAWIVAYLMRLVTLNSSMGIICQILC